MQTIIDRGCGGGEPAQACYGAAKNFVREPGTAQGVTMAAFINFPDGFDASLQDPAVIVAHPGGGVKEQTAGLYARKLAEQGFCHHCL